MPNRQVISILINYDIITFQYAISLDPKLNDIGGEWVDTEDHLTGKLMHLQITHPTSSLQLISLANYICILLKQI